MKFFLTISSLGCNFTGVFHRGMAGGCWQYSCTGAPRKWNWKTCLFQFLLLHAFHTPHMHFRDAITPVSEHTFNISIYVRIYIQEIGQMLDLVLSWKGGWGGCCFSKAENFWNKNEHWMSFHIPGDGALIMSSSGTTRSFSSRSWKEYVWEPRWIKVWPFSILSFLALSHRLVFRFPGWSTLFLLKRSMLQVKGRVWGLFPTLWLCS